MPAKKNLYPNKLTIILCIKDKPEFTDRWMRFMNDQQCPYKILIADGGKNKKIEKQLSSSLGYKNLNFKYIRFPFDKKIEYYYLKILETLKAVKTKYVIFADNDDFYLLDKIPSLIIFLEKNKDYSGCRGKEAYFHLSRNGKTFINCANGDNYKIVDGVSSSIENHSFIERAELFFNKVNQQDFWQNWYCIQRTEGAIKILNVVRKYNFQDAILSEILFHLMLLKLGKVKVTNQLFYLRQIGSSLISSSIMNDKNLLEYHLENDIAYNLKKFIYNKEIFNKQEESLRVMKAYSNFIRMWCILNIDEFEKKIHAKIITIFLLRLIMNKKVFFIIKKIVKIIFNQRKIRLPFIKKYIVKNNAIDIRSSLESNLRS